MADVLTKLPEFPTPWGEEEEKRLSQLQQQKTRMEELWKTKFSPDAWSRTSPPEKAIRNIMAGQVFEPIARAVSPWQWGFDYGVIPGDFREQMFETEAQYQEMIRMQRVVSVLPSILNTLRALALTNATIVTTKEELDKYFKLTKIGFTDEETAYVVDFARNILRTNLEELASGESLGLKQITAEELESLIGGTRPVLSPTQVLSTVAFSSDLAQIQQALQLAYPPGGGERSTTSGKEMLLQQYLEALRSLGIIQEEGEPLSDAAARAFDMISEGQGWAIPTDEAGVPIIDPNTNEPVIYNIDKDSYVWYGNEIIGFYSAEKNDIVPLSLSGEPILDEEHKERLIVDWFQAAVVDTINIGYMGRQFFLNTVPMFLRTLARAPFGAVEGEPTVSGMYTPQQRMGLPPELEGKPITEEDIPHITAFQQGLVGVNPYDRRLLEIQQDYEADAERRLENFHISMGEFYKANPEYLPRAEWEEPMIDRWNRDKRELLDVGYLGYQMASNMSTYLAMLASIGVTYATKNPTLGMATAMALFTPLQTESLKQDLMDSGATYEQAVGMALPGGILISSIEGVGNIPVQKAVAPQFFRAFRRDLSKGMAAHIGRRFLEYGVKTPIKIITTETFLEEVPQEVLHNLIVQSIDKNRHLLENIPEVVLQTMTTMLPMGIFGGGAQYYNMKRFLRADLLAKLESDSQALQDIGVEKDKAETIVFANLMATETGEAAVWAAKEKMDAEIPHTKWDTYTGEEHTGMTWEEWQDTCANSADFAESISNLEGELTGIATQVEELTSQLEERESRLSKAEIIGNREDIKTQREVVTYLKEQVAELEIRRDKLLASMEQLRQASEQAEVSESLMLMAEEWSREEVAQILPDDIDYAVTSLLEIWSGIPMKERVRLAKKAGLDKKIGSKAGLTNEQAKAIALVRLQEAVAEVESEVTPTAPVISEVLTPEGIIIPAERGRLDTSLTKEVKALKAEAEGLIDESMKLKGEARQEMNRRIDDLQNQVSERLRAITDIDKGLVSPLVQKFFPDLAVTPTAQAVTPTVQSVGDKVITADKLTDAERLFRDANIGAVQAYINEQAKRAGAGTSQEAVDKWLAEQRAAQAVTPQEAAITPEQVEAIPMPESTQLDLLAQADAWLDQVGKHEPNALHIIGIAEGEVLIRTDSEGKPLMVVTLLMRDGQLTLSTIVAAKPRRLVNGKALQDIINYIEKRGDIAFPPKAEMSPDAVRLYDKIMAKRAKAATEATSADDTIPPHREELPKKTAWKTEQEQVELAGKLHPEISEHIVKPKHLRQAQAKAQSEWASLDEKGKAALAKKLELGKTLVAKSWGEMTSIERAILTLNAIPDGSLNFHMRWELADMEEFCEVMEELTGLPFLAIYRRATEVKSVADATKEYILKEIIERPEFYKILKDDLAKARVGQELNARNKIQGVEHPANITQAELELVNLIEYHYNSYKPFVRYMEFMREEANMKALKARFPDAVKEGKVNELALALELRKKGDFTGLWNFLKEATWGVVESGFDPRRISYPDFRFRETAMGTVRGEDSLNRRTKIEFPEGKLEGDVIERFTNYVTQMEIQWHIESELHNFEKLWKLAYRKFNNKNMVKIALNRWWRAMQGIPPEYNWADRIFKRFWRQSMAAIFIEPALSLRNSFQAINLHMDRTELAKVLIKSSLDPVLKIKSKRYFEVMVSQLGGLRKYQQLIGQPGLPGLGPLNRLTDSIKLSALYGWSDYIPRLWSFNAYMNKAWRATQQYLKDGNVANWLKNSGAIHLRDSERNYVLSHFLARASDTFNLQVDTLDAVTGAEMAALYVAQRNTDRTHFKYRRELRGAVEMGPLGETLFNLFVFPRGYAQRLTFQTEKIVNAFRGETSWSEARTGFNDMLGLFIMSQLFSGFWRSLTGRKRNPYDPFGILTQWTFGGLFIGGAVEVTEFLTSLAMIINPYVDEDLKDRAKGQIFNQLANLLDLYVPIYKRAIDIVSAVAGTKDQDIYWLRRLREQLDSKYTAPELEQLDMNLWEQMKKAILGADPVPPDVFEKAQLKLEEARDMIGTRDITGKYFTLGDYGNLVASVTKGFPDILTSEYAGSHALDIFYKECEAQWEEYYLLPTSPTTIRRKWREEHPEEEAMMLFWEKLSSSVFPAGSEGWETVAGLLLLWFNLYKLDKTMHKEWANWGLDLYQEPRR